MPSLLSNGNNALKSAIEFNLYKEQNIGLNVKVNYEFLSKNPEPSLEYLKNNIITEVVVTSVTTLDNTASLSCGIEYVPKKGKLGGNTEKFFIETIKIIHHANVVNRKLK